MATLGELRLKASEAEADFETACRAAGYGDRWSAYRAELNGHDWAPALVAAHDVWIGALHAFYEARDGARGFLGARGL